MLFPILILAASLATRSSIEGAVATFLVSGLTGARSNAKTRAFALAALRQMKPESKQAVETLKGLLTCTDPVLRTKATNALLELDPVAAAKAGCKKL